VNRESPSSSDRERAAASQAAAAPCSPVTVEEHTVSTRDGLRLFVRHLIPPKEQTARVLFFVHGACDHGGRSLEFAEFAAAQGWHVYLPDLRGHGLSGGTRVHVTSFAEYVADLNQLFEHFRLPSGRTAVVGQSMGGLVSARFAQTYPQRIAALVLLSPLLRLKLPVNPLTLLAGRLLALVAPRTRFRSGIRSEDLTSDDSTRERSRQDPLLQKSVTAQWYLAAEQAMKDVHRDIDRIRCPLLLLQGGNDRIVDPAASRAWSRQVAHPDCTFEFFPEHRHELLQEPDRLAISQRILDWLEARIPACD